MDVELLSTISLMVRHVFAWVLSCDRLLHFVSGVHCFVVILLQGFPQRVVE